MHFSFIIYEQEPSANLGKIQNEYLKQEDSIGSTKIISGAGFGAGIAKILDNKWFQYNKNNFQKLNKVYPTLYDDAEGHRWIANAIQDFSVEQKVNLLGGELQVFQNYKGDLSLLKKKKKRGSNPEEKYLIVANSKGNFKLHNVSSIVD